MEKLLTNLKKFLGKINNFLQVETDDIPDYCEPEIQNKPQSWNITKEWKKQNKIILEFTNVTNFKYKNKFYLYEINNDYRKRDEIALELAGIANFGHGCYTGNYNKQNEINLELAGIADFGHGYYTENNFSKF